MSLAEKSSLLFDEIHDRNWRTQEIRYRPTEVDGRPSLGRFVSGLVPQHRPADETQTPLPLRQSGVYLITGGFGGVGMKLAEFLAKKVKARLILLGREQLPPREEWDRKVQPGHGDRMKGEQRIFSPRLPVSRSPRPVPLLVPLPRVSHCWS